MKLLQIFLISILCILASCGYKPINKMTNNNFGIKSYDLKGNNEINKFLKLNFDRFKNLDKSKNKFKIISSSEVIKSISSKNSSGETTGYKITIVISITLYKEKKEIVSNVYKKETSYNNLNSKFELKQYEKILIKDLVAEIIREINYLLLSTK